MFPRVNLRHLQAQYPDLDISTIDTDPETAYRVAEATLAHYFGVTARLSRAHLTPRIPARLQYLAAIERLCEPADVVREQLRIPEGALVDVGTGAAAIMPLLHCKRYWVATECNKSSVDHAAAILKANNLQEQINLRHQALWPAVPVRYLVCNPPFYHDEGDLRARHRAKRGAKMGAALPLTASELYYPGGEVAFIKWMIDSSRRHNSHPFAWYSSLVGIYGDIGAIVAYLNQVGASNNVVIPLRLGPTTRWVVAWAFHDVPAPPALDTSPPQRGWRSLPVSLTTKPYGDYVVAAAPTWLRKYRRALGERQQLMAGLIVARVDSEVQVVANYSAVDTNTIRNSLSSMIAGCEPAAKRHRRA